MEPLGSYILLTKSLQGLGFKVYGVGFRVFGFRSLG